MTAKKADLERKPNPTALVLGNPPIKGELFGYGVSRLEYQHIDDAENVVRFHDFRSGVHMYALEDGSILLVNSQGDVPLWADH